MIRSNWLWVFIGLRNDREHKGWTPNRVNYHFTSASNIRILIPEVNNKPIDEYSRISANQIFLFVENVMAYGFQVSERIPVYLVEIPQKQRDTYDNKRFRADPVNLGHEEKWEIEYKEEFDFI